jgi:hypothetical protein
VNRGRVHGARRDPPVGHALHRPARGCAARLRGPGGPATARTNALRGVLRADLSTTPARSRASQPTTATRRRRRAPGRGARARAGPRRGSTPPTRAATAATARARAAAPRETAAGRRGRPRPRRRLTLRARDGARWPVRRGQPAPRRGTAGGGVGGAARSPGRGAALTGRRRCTATACVRGRRRARGPRLLRRHHLGGG